MILAYSNAGFYQTMAGMEFTYFLVMGGLIVMLNFYKRIISS